MSSGIAFKAFHHGSQAIFQPYQCLSLLCTFPALTSPGSTCMNMIIWDPPTDPTELLAADWPWFHSLRKTEPGHWRDEVSEREIRGWEGVGGKEKLSGKNDYLIKEWDNAGSFEYNQSHQGLYFITLIPLQIILPFSASVFPYVKWVDNIQESKIPSQTLFKLQSWFFL